MGNTVIKETCGNINDIIAKFTAANSSFDCMVKAVMVEIIAAQTCTTKFFPPWPTISASTWCPSSNTQTLISSYHDKHHDVSLLVHWGAPTVDQKGGCTFSQRKEPLEEPFDGIERFEQHFVKNVTLSININGVLTHFVETISPIVLPPTPVVCPTTVLSAVTQCCHKDRREKSCHKDRREKICHRTHRSKDCCKNNRQKDY